MISVEWVGSKECFWASAGVLLQWILWRACLLDWQIGRGLLTSYYHTVSYSATRPSSQSAMVDRNRVVPCRLIAIPRRTRCRRDFWSLCHIIQNVTLLCVEGSWFCPSSERIITDILWAGQLSLGAILTRCSVRCGQSIYHPVCSCTLSILYLIFNESRYFSNSQNPWGLSQRQKRLITIRGDSQWLLGVMTFHWEWYNVWR